MDFLQSALLGIVEGVTEFLPISSTAHLILAGRVLGLAQTDFLKSFEIAIQLGAIGSVVALYWRKLFINTAVMKRVAAAFIPTAAVGFFLYEIVKGLFFEEIKIILWALLLGGAAIIFFEKAHREKEHAREDLESLPYRHAFAIGAFQSLAVIPGVSRAAATILGGLLTGMKRTAIVEFSFLLAVPTMLAATAFDLVKSAPAFSLEQFGLLAVGFLVSFAVAIASIKFLLRFIGAHSFSAFGWYRILVALFSFWFLL